jgi:hypothetical protein
VRNEKNIKQKNYGDRRLILDLTYPNPKYYRDRDSLATYRKQYIKRTKYPFEERTFEHFIRRPEIYREMFYNQEYYWRFLYELTKVMPALLLLPENKIPIEIQEFTFKKTFSSEGFKQLQYKLLEYKKNPPKESLSEELKLTPEELFEVRLALKRFVLLQKFHLYVHPNRAMVWEEGGFGRILQGLTRVCGSILLKIIQERHKKNIRVVIFLF